MIDIEFFQELLKCFMKSKDCIKAVTLIDRLLYLAGMAEAGGGGLSPTTDFDRREVNATFGFSDPAPQSRPDLPKV